MFICADEVWSFGSKKEDSQSSIVMGLDSRGFQKYYE